MYITCFMRLHQPPISAKLKTTGDSGDEIMNQERQYKPKNWQWRVIISSILLLIFAKPFGHWMYNLLGIDEMYAASTSIMKQVGMADTYNATAGAPLELVLDIKNDTPNDYTVETKISSGQVDLPGRTLGIGEIKHITIKPYSKIVNPVGRGDIIFLSAPIAGNDNRTCQEVHTLNYDLKYANQIKQPVSLNLSAISSKLECKDNAVNPSDDDTN